ncbi:MAG: DUF4367 domain-containing protein, partial [Methanolobus sp.]|nr:DUF4367 domain-containing protein [Methanolobus sp.]
ALFISGCIGQDYTADQIAEKMQEKQANIEDYSATVHITSGLENYSQIMEYEVMQKNPDKSRAIVRLPEEEAGTITIRNGEKMWIYSPEQNLVQVIDIPELYGDYETDYLGIIGYYLNETEISVEGYTKYEGRETYVITSKPNENQSEDDFLAPEIKAWIDKETWMPLKIKFIGKTGKNSEEEYYSVIEYRNFKVNSGISDELFEFEVPEGAEIENIGDFEDLLPLHTTLEEVQEKSSYDILIPSYLPEGYELVHTMFNNDSLGIPEIEASFTLVYSNGENEMMIISEEIFHEEDIGSIPMPSEGENIFINGVDAKFVIGNGDSVILQWKTDNMLLVIDAALEKDEIIRIAESMQV